MSENEEVQITVPKRGRPPKATPDAASESLVAEELAPADYKAAPAAPEPEPEPVISEQTRREMEAGRKIIDGYR